MTAKAYDPTGNVGSSGRGERRGPQRRPARALKNGGFEGSTAPWVLSGNAYFSNGGYQHSGTGYSVLGTTTTAGRDRVPDGRDPGDGYRQPVVLAQRDVGETTP